jgi:predicted dehydrogenase
MTPKRTVAIVGMGPMGLSHAAITNSLGRGRVVAMVDSDERLLLMGKKVLRGINFFSNVEDMIRTLAPDCVYVCTPPPTHVDIVQAIFRAGSPKAIFVEKPLATRANDAKGLAEEARRRNILGVIGFQKRFNRVFEESRRLVQSGAIGKVRLVRANDLTAGQVAPATGWRGEPGSGGVTLEWGIHLLDLLLWTFGTPISVKARRMRLFSDRVEDVVSASLTFPGGVLGLVELGWNLRNYNPPDLFMEIHGTEGAISVNEDRLVVYTKKRESESVGGRPAPMVVHSTQVTPPLPFLLGQPENIWQEVRFHDALDGRLPAENTWDESIPLHNLIDQILSVPLE